MISTRTLAVSSIATIVVPSVVLAQSGTNRPPNSPEAAPVARETTTAVPASPVLESPRKDEGPPTLLSNKAPRLGGYGGPSVFGSRTMGQNVVYAGGEAALLLDHRLAIGLAGYALVSHVGGPTDVFGDPQRLGFGYAGLLLRYSFLGNYPYYFTVGTLVGGGGVGYLPEWNGNWSRHRATQTDPALVVEPSLGGHLNLTRWMRLGVQVSYRFVSIAGVSNAAGRPSAEDLAGFAYGGHLQFGWL
jgi:hypothetical protein